LNKLSNAINIAPHLMSELQDMVVLFRLVCL
jgi:hypothetical protein